MKKIKFICALLPLFLLQGCFDSRDVKDVAIVMGMGVEAGKNETYNTITQVVLPGGLSKDGGGDTFENYSGEGEHIGECIEKATLSCEKYMYLSHATALVIDEKIAKNGIYEILDYFMRDNELRSNLAIAVSGNINKVMNTESKLLKVPLSGVASLKRRFRETSLGISPTVFDFVSDMLKKDCATIVPIISENGVSGSAVFKNGKMIEKISNTEARGILWLLNKMENAIITVSLDGATFDIKIKSANAKIKPVYENEIIKAEIKCKASLLRDDKGVLNAFGTKRAEEQISAQIKSEILAAFDKMQIIDADVYGFSDMVYKKNAKNWSENIFQKIKLDIAVDSEIDEVGNILRSAGR